MVIGKFNHESTKDESTNRIMEDPSALFFVFRTTVPLISSFAAKGFYAAVSFSGLLAWAANRAKIVVRASALTW